MKINFGRISLLICFLLVSACASMKVQLPVKYDLGDKLKQVPEIQDMRIGSGRAPSFTEFKAPATTPSYEKVANPGAGSGDLPFEPASNVIARRDTFTLSENQHQWIKVDNQSLILRNGPDEYYLLVLQSPADQLMTVDTISIVNTLNIIKAKKDLVDIGGQRYVIERIYKIDGSDKMLAIKNRILGG